MQAALHLAPVLAAEKSKTAFYIAGGALVLWALIVSVGIGMRRPDFPSNLAGQRTVMAITAVLVLAAVATAVATSGSPAQAGEGKSSAGQTQPTPSISSAPTPAPSSNTTTSAGAATSSTTTSPGAATSRTTTSPGAATSSTTTAPEAATPSPAATQLALQANPSGQLSFNTKTLSAKAGNVSITMTNGSPLEHNLTIAKGASVLGATPTFIGGARTVTLTLKPGTYTFYCSVPGHRYAGMEGTLKVS